jgi:hypothetical protein
MEGGNERRKEGGREGRSEGRKERKVGSGVSHFALLWQIPCVNKLIKGGDLFGLIVSQVSVRGWLAKLISGLWWGRILWPKDMVKEIYPHPGGQVAKGDRKGPWTRYPSKAHPQSLTSSNQASPPNTPFSINSSMD